jgi:MFS family permease
VSDLHRIIVEALTKYCRPTAAPTIGPVLGGVIVEKAGWQWIFRFLTILSGLNLVLVTFCLPETGRAIVGNGSLPASGINRTPISCMTSRRQPSPTPSPLQKPKLRVPNPLLALKILFKKDAALLMFANGVFYINYQCSQSSLSSLFMSTYGLNALQAGLCYLPYGIATTGGTYLTGELAAIAKQRLIDSSADRW